MKLNLYIKNTRIRIALAIVAAILLLIVCMIAHAWFWFWVCWQVLAAGLVTIGCVGEWHLFIASAKEGEQDGHKRNSLRFITLAAIGVCMQFTALIYTIPDALRLQREVAMAKADLERVEIARLELERQVLRLVETTKTRIVGRETIDALTRDLANIPMGQIEILAFDKDPEAIAFGISLKRALVEAGCSASFSPKSIFNLDIIPSIAELGPDLVFCVKNPASPPLYAQIILARLKASGIKASGWPHNDSFPPDHLQIWVCPKTRIPDLNEREAEQDKSSVRGKPRR